MTNPHTDSADELARAAEEKITTYLLNGGLFNPELANHDAVRDLLIECRDALAAYRARPAPETAGEAVAVVRYMTTGGNVGIAWLAVPTDAAPLLPDGTKLYTAPAPAQRMSEEQERAAFEAWCKVNRPDLDLRFEYDAQGNYHWHGYIWDETDQALRLWQAGAAWGVKLKD